VSRIPSTPIKLAEPSGASDGSRQRGVKMPTDMAASTEVLLTLS
jgi:hypothetical protein